MGLARAVKQLRVSVEKTHEVTLFHYVGLLDASDPPAKQELANMVAAKAAAGEISLLGSIRQKIDGFFKRFAFKWPTSLQEWRTRRWD